MLWRDPGGRAAASVKLMYAPQPKPAAIKALAEVTVTKLACGHNHTVALDDAGAVYSWGKQPIPGCGHLCLWAASAAFLLLNCEDNLPSTRHALMPLKAKPASRHLLLSLETCGLELAVLLVVALVSAWLKCSSCCAGNGGYGRLGHEVQQDEFKPRQIQRMTGRTAADPKSIVRACACCLCSIDYREPQHA